MHEVQLQLQAVEMIWTFEQQHNFTTRLLEMLGLTSSFQTSMDVFRRAAERKHAVNRV